MLPLSFQSQKVGKTAHVLLRTGNWLEMEDLDKFTKAFVWPHKFRLPSKLSASGMAPCFNHQLSQGSSCSAPSVICTVANCTLAQTDSRLLPWLRTDIDYEWVGLLNDFDWWKGSQYFGTINLQSCQYFPAKPWRGRETNLRNRRPRFGQWPLRRSWSFSWWLTLSCKMLWLAHQNGLVQKWGISQDGHFSKPLIFRYRHFWSSWAVKGSCFDSILQANSNGFGTRLMRWLNDQNKTGNYGRRIIRTVSSYGMRTVRWPWIFGVTALQVTWPFFGSSGRAETSNLVAGPTTRVESGLGWAWWDMGMGHNMSQPISYNILGEQISSNFHWPTIFGYQKLCSFDENLVSFCLWWVLRRAAALRWRLIPVFLAVLTGSTAPPATVWPDPGAKKPVSVKTVKTNGPWKLKLAFKQ